MYIEDVKIVPLSLDASSLFGFYTDEMNVCALSDEPVTSRPWNKKGCFDNEIELTLTIGLDSSVTKSQRRKQRGKVELLLEDDFISDEDAKDDHREGCDAVSAEMTNMKADRISSAELVNHENRTTTPEENKSRTFRQQSSTTIKLNAETIVHHLVREYLLTHCHEDIARILDQERVSNVFYGNRNNLTSLYICVQSMPILTVAEHRHLYRHFTSTNQPSESPSNFASLLECLLVCSNETQLKTKSKRSTATSAIRQKPVLSVIIADLKTDADNIGVTPEHKQRFNLLSHPGSTPFHYSSVIGGGAAQAAAAERPSLSREIQLARFKDLEPLKLANVDNVALTGVVEEADGNEGQYSHYARRKRHSSARNKRVQLGESGSTPTKEYYFFRETPPLFVTETMEAAVEILERLNSNAEFASQVTTVDRFLELQSSEVSKYSVGQVIEKLGPQSDINGVVSKIYGSRLCGTAGSGSIIIDTCPENL
ncbi:hypothetical protein Plhal703r1_c33g0125931 [Plasmopara halstedii]